MSWLARVKRRRPGIYAYRTFRHMAPGTEWGYVGKSRDLVSRGRDHAGTGRWGHAAKDWHDLVVRRYTLRLPWWLGWDWITLSLETLAILLLRPRYNWQKNPYAKKAGPREQKLQRRARELYPKTQQTWQQMTAAYAGVRLLGIIIILVGIGGYFAWGR